MATRTTLDRRELLGRVWLFSELSGRDLDLLAEYVVRKQVPARAEVVHRGDEGDEAYAIASGRLKASVRSPDGKEITFSIMDPGEVFGELAMLQGVKRTATVVALEASELLVLRRRDLMSVMERQPDIARKCLNAVAGRLIRLSQNMEDALLLDLPARLARKLLALATNYGEAAGDSTRIGFKLSQTELGNMVGTTRESVNKQLKTWEREGLIANDQGIISLLDVSQMEDVAAAIDL